MSLIIEDGTLPAGADSFASLDEFRAYAEAYGVTIPAADLECEQMLRSAAVEMWNRPWTGSVITEGQPLPWPRTVEDGTIPADIVRGQMALAAEMYADKLAKRGPDDRVLTGKSIAGAISYTWSESRRAASASGRRSGVLFSRYLSTRSGQRMVRG